MVPDTLWYKISMDVFDSRLFPVLSFSLLVSRMLHAIHYNLQSSQKQNTVRSYHDIDAYFIKIQKRKTQTVNFKASKNSWLNTSAAVTRATRSLAKQTLRNDCAPLGLIEEDF